MTAALDRFKADDGPIVAEAVELALSGGAAVRPEVRVWAAIDLLHQPGRRRDGLRLARQVTGELETRGIHGELAARWRLLLAFHVGQAGVIVDLGKLSTLFNASGQFTPPKVTGTGVNFPQVDYNLYFDTNGDGHYFDWGSHDPYSYTGMDGDSAASMGPVNTTSDQADFTTFAGQPGASDLGGTLTGQMSMENVQKAFASNTGGTTDPEVWAWIGVQTTPDQTATITSVNGTNLVSTYAAPVTGLKVAPGYTSLTATWKASSAATSYQVTVTQHNGSTIIATTTATGTSCRIGHLKAKNTYAVKVLALPAAPGQKATVVYTTTK